jgi:hypothetical protein
MRVTASFDVLDRLQSQEGASFQSLYEEDDYFLSWLSFLSGAPTALATEPSGPDPDKLAYLRVSDGYTLATANMNQIRWTYWPRTHPVSNRVVDVLNAFGSLPNLRELTTIFVVLDSFPGFNLKSFSNLSSLAITCEQTMNISQDFISDVADLVGRCPDLDCITFCIPRPYYPPDPPFLMHLFAGLPSTTRLKLRLLDVTGLRVSADDFRVHLHHFLSLKVLRLMFNR